jgi:hypothetical protein
LKRHMHSGRWRPVALAATIFLALPVQTVLAQSSPPLSAQWWPSGGDTIGSRLSAFGSAVHCTLGRCDQAASIGASVRVLGSLRVGVDARMPGLDYGISYGWRRVDVAATVGRGTNISFAGTPPRMLQGTRNMIDSLGHTRVDTVLTPVPDSSVHDAIRWTSAAARLTWREERWWATALLGRVAVARQGAALWGGLQLGADIGRGAALLLGLGTTSRLIALAAPEPLRHTVSLGLGFNTSILSSSGARPAPTAPDAARAAFDASNIGPGRIRITIRAPSARTVSFASDCTGWQPLEMTPTRDGWVIEVAAPRGAHRVNIRIDGGRWIAPPGLAPIDDDFAGEVGIFVVE